MPRQSVNINFARGLDTKTDPKQVSLGNFLVLQNAVFDTGGLLKKRNGFQALESLPENSGASYITTLGGNLTALGGSSILALTPSGWIQKGDYAPMGISTLPLVRNGVNQTQCDAVISSNGLVCTAYMQQSGSYSSGLTTTQFLYVIASAHTGQNVIEPTLIPPLGGGTISGPPRVFLIGNYFVIVATVHIGGSFFLQYVGVPVENPSNPNPPQNVFAEAYSPGLNISWDGVVCSSIEAGTLVIAYNTTSGGQGIHVTYLNQLQISTNQAASLVYAVTGSNYQARVLSVCVDTTPTIPIFYVSFAQTGNSVNGYTFAITVGAGSISSVFAPQQIITAQSIPAITSAASNGTCYVISEVANNYGYDSSIPTNYLNLIPVSSSGSVGSTVPLQRSVGLSSKALIANGSVFVGAAYQSQYQPTYFMMAYYISNGAIAPVAKFAYQNGGGYVHSGLPSLLPEPNGGFSLAYLFKDLVEALAPMSPSNNSSQEQSGGIYSQTGINLATFSAGSIGSVELASNLSITGGFGWMYDGYLPVENNFFLFPDNVEATWTTTSTVTPTGSWSSGSNSITVSSGSGIAPGMTITDSSNPSYIPSGTTVLSVSGTTVTLSKNTTHAASGDSLSIQGNIAAQPDGATNNKAYAYIATYEWSDNNGLLYRSAPSIPVFVTTSGSGSAGVITVNIPTIRLTLKTATPPNIVLYRWSVNQQSYFQVTSITSPIQNVTTSDYVTFVDTLPDESIDGNNLIYTTGGVAPDTNPPAMEILSTWDTRAWGVSAENTSVLWFSKQIIQGASVEWSSLFTLYVSPNIGTQGSTGPITALAPMDDKLIIFKADSIYYINGVGAGPDNTGNNNQYGGPFFITGIVGCSEPQSIVLTPDGLQFQTDKGIWILGRDLSTNYIGAPVESFNKIDVNSAVGVPKTNQLRFTLAQGGMLMYDMYYKQWGQFVLGTDAPVSSCIYNGLHTYITGSGGVYQETPDQYLDNDNPVLIHFETGPINLAGIQGYQRIYEFYLLGEYISPHTLNIDVTYNYNPSIRNSVVISPTNVSGASPSNGFGVPVPFGSPSPLEQWRIHTKLQYCQNMQITLQENYNPAFGIPAGAGFTMSGIMIIADLMRGWRPISGATSTGVS